MFKQSRAGSPKRFFLVLSSVVVVGSLVGVALSVVLGGPPRASSGRTAPGQATTAPVDLPSITTAQLLHSAIGQSSGAQAQLLHAIEQQVQAYPAASEPALVSLLQTLGGSGNLPAAYVSTSMAGRTNVWSAPLGTPNLPTGYRPVESTLVSPLILDLRGTGRPDVANQTVDAHPSSFSPVHTTLFDITADGFVDFTEWVGPGAGLLIHPTAADTITSTHGQLAWQGPLNGANLLGTVGGYQNGFEHLAMFDTDHDGRISGAELNQLYVWTDTNGNGTIDPGELHTPQSLGITALALQHTGNTGSYTRNGTTERMWDWWPTFLQVFPTTKSTSAVAQTAAIPAACPAASMSLQGHLSAQQAPDLTTTIASNHSSTTWTIPLAALTPLGFNPNASLLARVSPAGTTLVLVDYRQQAPHTARLWMLTRTTMTAWGVTRFALPEASLDQVLFDASGTTLFLLAQNQTHLYVVRNLAALMPDQHQAGSPQLASIGWNTPDLGFRTLWGTPLAQGAAFYLPGYFYTADGLPRCASLAQLTLLSDQVTLQPFADLQWLTGEEVSTGGFSVPFVSQLASPELAYAAVKNAQGGVTLLAISGRQAATGKITPLDTMQAIGGLSTNATSVEYLARQSGGGWQVRWVDLAALGDAQQRPLALAMPPSYPELTGSGKEALWAVFDWGHGTTTLWGLNTTDAQATPQPVISFHSMTGAIRVASAAMLMAIQTPTQLIVWSMSP